MSKNSQKSTLDTFRIWLTEVNPKSESLHQPKVHVETVKQPFKKRY